MEILIISGLSGGGKSQTASFLEDMGVFVVDNLPAAMILKFAEFCATGSSRYQRVALVCDVRTGESFEELFAVLNVLSSSGVSCKLLFLEATPRAIIKRYKETRRRHPLANETTTLEQAVNQEIDLMSTMRQRADYIIDTTDLATAKLRAQLGRLFVGEDEGANMEVQVVSFGFKHGIPLEADLVFDVRFLPNPFYIDDLRHKTGLDAEVYDYVMSFPQSTDYVAHLKSLLGFSLPWYVAEGKSSLVIAIGCTGGHHRSVSLTRAVAEFVEQTGFSVSQIHRDIMK
ncbi:RNase adapter RapZ [Bengtsoniella intestinalis]|uniref:RNase adapter RapZ n=1 Tax=Bengtsoniella intestinalis TaxID=3073143 RepID=UPI00391EFD1C